MKRRLLHLLVVVAVVVAACSSETGETTTSTSSLLTTTTTQASAGETARPLFVIEEVGVGDVQYVLLRNLIGLPRSLLGFRLCQADDCTVLPDVPVTRDVVLFEGAEPPIAAQVSVAGVDLPDLEANDGELALFDSASLTADSMHMYLEWGSTPHATTAVAVEAGMWLEGTFAPSGPNASRLWRDRESGLWLWE